MFRNQLKPGQYVLTALMSVYRYLISPVIHLLAGPGFGCRFEPTCSVYFNEAVSRHGWYRGVKYGVVRLCRCHPFSGRSGWDPVPETDNKV